MHRYLINREYEINKDLFVNHNKRGEVLDVIFLSYSLYKTLLCELMSDCFICPSARERETIFFI